MAWKNVEGEMVYLSLRILVQQGQNGVKERGSRVGCVQWVVIVIAAAGSRILTSTFAGKWL